MRHSIINTNHCARAGIVTPRLTGAVTAWRSTAAKPATSEADRSSGTAASRVLTIRTVVAAG